MLWQYLLFIAYCCGACLFLFCVRFVVLPGEKIARLTHVQAKNIIIWRRPDDEWNSLSTLRTSINPPTTVRQSSTFGELGEQTAGQIFSFITTGTQTLPYHQFRPHSLILTSTSPPPQTKFKSCLPRVFFSLPLQLSRLLVLLPLQCNWWVKSSITVSAPFYRTTINGASVKWEAHDRVQDCSGSGVVHRQLFRHRWNVIRISSWSIW
jgi:hypothetical protein